VFRPFLRSEAMSEANKTTDHDEIRRWVEERDGRPAVVSGSGDAEILRIDFGPKDEGLEEVDWDEFFRVFDERKLAFLHQDKTSDGSVSRFSKFVNRD
jgi:hypothetical protein